ncbi:hypothetical protein XENTR_v10017580 [Xenopus tropicalis]|nr:hypothetical protein XENTR_v10017580 [Xenopus tropicalis]
MGAVLPVFAQSVQISSRRNCWICGGVRVQNAPPKYGAGTGESDTIYSIQRPLSWGGGTRLSLLTIKPQTHDKQFKFIYNLPSVAPPGGVPSAPQRVSQEKLSTNSVKMGKIPRTQRFGSLGRLCEDCRNVSRVCAD